MNNIYAQPFHHATNYTPTPPPISIYLENLPPQAIVKLAEIYADKIKTIANDQANFQRLFWETQHTPLNPGNFQKLFGKTDRTTFQNAYLYMQEKLSAFHRNPENDGTAYKIYTLYSTIVKEYNHTTETATQNTSTTEKESCFERYLQVLYLLQKAETQNSKASDFRPIATSDSTDDNIPEDTSFESPFPSIGTSSPMFAMEDDFPN